MKYLWCPLIFALCLFPRSVFSIACTCVPSQYCNDDLSRFTPCGKNSVCCHDVNFPTTRAEMYSNNEQGAMLNKSNNCTCVPEHLCADVRETSVSIIMKKPIACGVSKVCCHKIIEEPVVSSTVVYSSGSIQEESATQKITATTRVNKFKGKGGPAKFRKGCGLANNHLNVHNKNGEMMSIFARENEFPWTVQILASDDYDLICGATILQYTVVVTAAHCVEGLKASDIVVRGGEWVMNRPDEILETVDRAVEKIVIHPDFDEPSSYADIAILFLIGHFTESLNTKTICLPDPQHDYVDFCFATGWGATDKKVAPDQQTLMKRIPLKRIYGSECEEKLRSTSLGPEFELSDTSICAVPLKGDTALGDGGGPMFCKKNEKTPEFVLVGITSWGTEEKGAPGVYTDYQTFSDWAQLQINEYFSQ